ncbi:hypothetical protein NOVOSPHI9U_20031 [Novosphingobium sp. 9U]|nr:hypothetical protein NOVOSPHI9U_20031 [Novosphingobium sp. 9U]
MDLSDAIIEGAGGGGTPALMPTSFIVGRGRVQVRAEHGALAWPDGRVPARVAMLLRIVAGAWKHPGTRWRLAAAVLLGAAWLLLLAICLAPKQEAGVIPLHSRAIAAPDMPALPGSPEAETLAVEATPAPIEGTEAFVVMKPRRSRPWGGLRHRSIMRDLHRISRKRGPAWRRRCSTKPGTTR